jgi:cyclopropane-fatty-acyl-phospholipid synthase
MKGGMQGDATYAALPAAANGEGNAMEETRCGLQGEVQAEPQRKSSAQRAVETIFSPPDVRVNGLRPWDIRVHHPDFYTRVLAGGSLALGESYMDGWWSCRALDQFFDRILTAGLDRQVRKHAHLLWTALKAKLINAQRPSQAEVIGKRHYDLGNRLFAHMLDKRMNYSCAFWDDAASLDEAQENKLALICRKIGLQPGMTVLDIGCGWGGFARWAAEKYQARVLGVTVSKEQAAFAREYCRGHDVSIEERDYRELEGRFDRVVSIGMLEHVGARNYRTFMQVVRRCLKTGGLLLVQTIGGNRSVSATDAWIDKYIFPNSMLPSIRQIASASEGLLVMEDWHSLGPHYDKTLMAWYRNFDRNWEKIKTLYDERFYRMWTYYLLSCAGSFRSRRNQLWQIVFSKKGIRGGAPYLRSA